MTDKPAGELDVSALVADITATVERKRKAGEYSEDLIEKLEADFDVADFQPAPETLAFIPSSRPLASGRPVVGKAIVTAKRAVRRLLAWYIHPITADQSDFNLAILREVRAIQRRLDALERESGRATDTASGSRRPE